MSALVFQTLKLGTNTTQVGQLCDSPSQTEPMQLEITWIKPAAEKDTSYWTDHLLPIDHWLRTNKVWAFQSSSIPSFAELFWTMRSVHWPQRRCSPTAEAPEMSFYRVQDQLRRSHLAKTISDKGWFLMFPVNGRHSFGDPFVNLSTPEKWEQSLDTSSFTLGPFFWFSEKRKQRLLKPEGLKSSSTYRYSPTWSCP